MPSSLAPVEDYVIPCQVRLWQNESIVVFVHRREWAKVGLWSGAPMIVTCHGVEFECQIWNAPEFYLNGRPKDLHPRDFDLPGHGDYEGLARIDWEKAIPELVVEGLLRDEQLAAFWRELPLAVIRQKVNHVLRARKASVQAERCLQLLGELALEMDGSK